MSTGDTVRTVAIRIAALDDCASPATRPADQSLKSVPVPESGVRATALNLHILELEQQLAALQNTIAAERALSCVARTNAATVSDRVSALEAELRACADARDTAGAVAAAAIAELREVRAMCTSMRRDLETLRTERDVAAAAAATARTRISELETALAHARASRTENKENIRILAHRLQN